MEETSAISPSSSTTMTTGDGSSPASAKPTLSEEKLFWKKKIEELLRADPDDYPFPGYTGPTSYSYEKRQELMDNYLEMVAPKLRLIAGRDNVKQFTQLYCGWGHYMGLRGYLLPEILTTMVIADAVRCAAVALEGSGPLHGCSAEPNRRHFFGFSPLHVAAENFNVDMVELLFRHGASANLRTEGTHVIEGLLPINVAVENTAMHKYLEDNWADGDHVVKLIFLLCLPEMKMFLDTCRLIATRTDNIVDELWSYADKGKLVQLAILLLAAQKQLRGCLNDSSGVVSLNGFDMVKCRIEEALHTVHLEESTMVEEGKNGEALEKLKDKKQLLHTAHTLAFIVRKAGEALDEYIQTDSKVPVSHEEILKHVSSILIGNGIFHLGKGIDTGNLTCYQYGGPMSSSQRVNIGGANEADKSSLKGKDCRRILGNRSNGCLKVERIMFFPYWKSILSARLMVKIVPPCQPSRKDMQSTSRKDMQSSEPIREGTQISDQPRFPNKSADSIGPTGLALFARNYECRRTFCAVASMSRKLLKRA